MRRLIKLLHRARKARGHTVAEACVKLLISQQTWRNWTASLKDSTKLRRGMHPRNEKAVRDYIRRAGLKV